jgi:hypothetical protein
LVEEPGVHAMQVALEINTALWIMIGCVAAKADQLAQFLN